MTLNNGQVHIYQGRFDYEATISLGFWDKCYLVSFDRLLSHTRSSIAMCHESARPVLQHHRNAITVPCGTEPFFFFFTISWLIYVELLI